MKTRFLLSLLVLPFCSMAQVSLGLHAGVAAPVSKNSLLSPKIGFKVGVDAVIPIYKGFKGHIGLDYNHFAFSYSLRLRNVSGTGMEIRSVTSSANYLGIPVGFRYVFLENAEHKLYPVLDAGVHVLSKLSESFDGEELSIPDELAPEATSVMVSPNVGIGIHFKPSKSFLATFLVSYVHQLDPMYSTGILVEEEGTYFQSITPQFSVGYKF